MIEVTVHRPDGSSEQFVYEKAQVMIGRAAGNDICLEVAGVSRYHARFAVEEDQILIQDLESTNGTFLNSERITSAPVSPADKVSIGEVVLTVERKEGAGDNPFLTLKEELAPKASQSQQEVTTGTLHRGEDFSPPPEPPVAVAPPEPPPVVVEERTVSKGDDFYWQSLKSFLAPVWQFITDDAISEIMINGPTEIYVESKGRLVEVDAHFTPDQLAAAVLNIAQYVGRRVSEEEPYLDARLPDGSRVAVLMPPCSRKGISIAIRKFSKEKLTIDRLLQFGSMSPEMVMYLEAAVLLKKNIIISGGTSSGKTSLLNCVSGLIPDDERIITIEDSAELQLRQEHVLPMETKPPDKKGRGQVTIRDLVRASLRMRPDRIVVGEIRSGEALDLLQAMNTGHSGSMATVHASSPRQALTRLETLALFSGLEIPMRACREQVSTAIEVIIQASRLPDHSRKVTHISEVNKLSDAGEYRVTDIFRFVREGSENGKVVGRHRWTGAIPGIMEEMELAGITKAIEFFQQTPESDAPSSVSEISKGGH